SRYTDWGDLKIPILLIHGKKDELVPIEDSRNFANIQSNCTEFYPAKGVHNLGNVIEEITQMIISWLTAGM
ncbi:hypothetical protein DF186_15375, partial [Enterococcus hirae]